MMSPEEGWLLLRYRAHGAETSCRRRSGCVAGAGRARGLKVVEGVLIMFLLCIPLLSGCGKTETKKAPAIPAATERDQKHVESQTPYYYGLIEELRTILAEDPDNLATIIALGNAYFDSGQWKQAVTMYEHALLIQPRNADVRADMATAFRNMGMADRAVAEYRAVLAYDSSHLNARYNLGIVYAYDKKDYQAAILAWQELLRLAPKHPRAESLKSSIASFQKLLKKGTK